MNISVAGLTPWLSAVSRKIRLIFGPDVHENLPDVMNLDLAALYLKEDQKQVSCHFTLDLLERNEWYE